MLGCYLTGRKLEDEQNGKYINFSFGKGKKRKNHVDSYFIAHNYHFNID